MRRVLKRYMGEMALGKEMQKEDFWGFVIKKNCAWQTLGFTKQTKGKSLIVSVDVKQKSILWLWKKNTEIYKGCESNSMGTSTKADGCRSR